MSRILHFAIYFLILILSNEAARILAVFPVPSFSHQVVFRHLTHELAKRGHEVVVITTDPAFSKGDGPANLTEIDVRDISYKTWRESFMTTASGKKENSAAQLQMALSLYLPIFLEQMNTDEVQNIIGNNGGKFDLLILEALFRPALVLSHMFKAPVIQISSFGGFYGNFETVGAATHPLPYASITRHKLYNLTTWEKIRELYYCFSMKNWVASREQIEDKELKRHFGHDVPSLNELSNNVHMLFLNVHALWDENRPVPPSVLYIGGIHVNPERELPQDLENYLNSSVKGVIYMSFGTNVNITLLPSEKIQMLLSVLSELPYNVLLKWDTDELPGRTKNIKISKWFPQSDLLKNPKIRLFITQAGLQSTDEAILGGVPLLGIPMWSDQWYNAEKYVRHKIGLHLDFEKLTGAEFKQAITTVIDDASYRNNILELRKQMFDRPQRPLERAVWWTEHVLRHGGARHLRAPAANISWREYLELDLLLTVLIILFIIVCLFFLILYTWVKYENRKIKMD